MGFFWNRNKETREVGYVPPAFIQQLTSISNFCAMNVSTVYRCTELIADSIATLPIMVKKKQGNGKTNIMKNHYANLLFDDRNAIMTKFNFIKLIVQSVVLKGNAFAIIERGADGIPVKLIFVESGDVTINYDKMRGTLDYSVNGYAKRFKPSDMLHFVKNSYDGIKGISVLKFAEKSIDLTKYIDENASNFFENGGQLSGILSASTSLSSKQRDEILSSWNTTYTHGGRGIAVLPGNLSYQSISATAEDSQMLQSREYQVAEIARFFGISPSLLGVNGYTYASLEQLQQEFLTHTLMPYIVMLENEFSRKLLKPEETNLKIIFDTNGILRADKQAQANYYTSLINAGVLTINEVRQDLGMNAVDGGDTNFVAYTYIAQNAINENNTTENIK